jgi:uncharacterized protein (DUF608 family)
VELRADGQLCDWNIFNNSPGGGGGKVQLNDALFGLWTKPDGGHARAFAMRTSAPSGLPSVAQIEYAGAYPVSRLRLSDPLLLLDVELFAYSRWVVGNPENSATPAILFTFCVSNPQPRQVEMAVCFNLPNHIEGVARSLDRGLRLDRPGSTPVSGSMALEWGGEGSASRATSDRLAHIWSDFSREGPFSNTLSQGVAKHGAVALKLRVPAGATKQIHFVLAWYFPNRTAGHDSERVGNYYARLFKGAEAVADRSLTQLQSIWQSLSEWQRICFDNDLPDWLQDAMINTASTMAKTGMWAEDGRWRQWESFSCSAIDPIHIHWYRALPYALFFPSLEKSEFRGYARGQDADGFIHEDLGGASSKLDTPRGRNMGDCTSAFILGVYELALWTGDSDWLREMWPYVRKAAEWQLGRAARFGLPEHLNNTYDWWDFDKKDVVAYNAVLHLASLCAAQKTALLAHDADFAERCRKHFQAGAGRVNELLWTGRYFRAWWMERGGFPDALHSDALYGQLWASILGLGWVVEPARAKSHLQAEAEFCTTEYGLKVMHGRGAEMIDDLVWQAGSLDWAALNLFLGGPAPASFSQADTVVGNWRNHLADFWDWRDLTRSDNGLPWCNSHYARQAILWAMPLALSGQQYSAIDKQLSFAPREDAPARLPWFIPGAAGVLERSAGQRWTLRLGYGKLELKKWSVGPMESKKPVTLAAGQVISLQQGTGSK